MAFPERGDRRVCHDSHLRPLWLLMSIFHDRPLWVLPLWVLLDGPMIAGAYLASGRLLVKVVSGLHVDLGFLVSGATG